MSYLDFDPTAVGAGFSNPLDDPRNRAALLQFGLTLMSPNYGNTPMGSVAQAVGSAGEAIKRQEDAGQAEIDREFKRAQIASQIGKREADVSTAQGKLDAQAARQAGREEYLGFRQQKQEQDARLRERQIGLSELFGRDKQAQRANKEQDVVLNSSADNILAAVAKERASEARAIPGVTNYQFPQHLAPYKNAVTREQVLELMQNDPAMLEPLRRRYGQGQGTVQQSQPGVRPISGTVEDSGRVTYPTPPARKEMLTDGQVYQTKKGPLRWNKDTEEFDPL